METKERILVISHGHPDFAAGGGEIAAYNLFQGYKRHQQVEAAWFLARIDRGRGATGLLSLHRPGEYLWEQAIKDWFRLKVARSRCLTTWFADLLRALRPTLIHAHHYVHLGVEYLRVIKQVDPNIKVILTLHEYMAICMNQGQMIKKSTGKLCEAESFIECHRCFPQHSPEDFWLRKQYFQRSFEFVDTFVAPSKFLRRRYIEWGLHPERIVVIENGHSAEPMLAPRQLREGEGRTRFGYFGQVTPFKGLDVLLAALYEIPEEERQKIVLEIHAANFKEQSEELREKIERLMRPLIESGVVQWVGPYRPSELAQRMSGIDWTVVPSTWWENSPMVIQESFVHGRPVICSNLGGMAEKVKNGVNGLHAVAGDPADWSKVLLQAMESQEVWDKLRAGIRAPLTVDECADVHLEILPGNLSPQDA